MLVLKISESVIDLYRSVDWITKGAAQRGRTEAAVLPARRSVLGLNTTDVWPRSPVPQPDGLDWELILRRQETGVLGENPRSQVKIDWNSTHMQHLQ